MFDRKEPYTFKTKEPGRNTLVTLVKDNQEMQIKYKRSKEYIENGWSLKSQN